MNRAQTRDRVPRDHVAIERHAEFGHPGLRLEIDVVQPEALFVSEDPFEIIHQAPQEVAANRHALRGRALQLRQIVAQVHDAVEIVDFAVGVNLSVEEVPFSLM